MRLLRLLSFLRLLRLLSPPFSFVSFFLLSHISLLSGSREIIERLLLIGAAVRLAAFNLPELARVTDSDEMYIGRLGEEKRAIFCVIPDNDTSLNFLVSMLYTCAHRPGRVKQ